MAALRKWLLAGLLVLVPLMITIAVINWVVSTLDKTLEILPAEWQPELLIGFYIPRLWRCAGAGYCLGYWRGNV